MPREQPGSHTTKAVHDKPRSGRAGDVEIHDNRKNTDSERSGKRRREETEKVTRHASRFYVKDQPVVSSENEALRSQDADVAVTFVRAGEE